MLIAEVKASEITSYIDEYYRNNLVVLFSGDELLFSSQQLTDAEIASIRTENEESFHIQLRSKNYRMAKESSLELGLTFYIGIPADRLYQGIRNFRILFIVEVLIAGVIALFLSWRFASRTYEPVKQLIDILGKHTDSRFQEIYDNLIVQLRKLVKENQILAESDKQRKLLADQAAMRRVLDGKITDAAAIEALLRESARISETDSYQMCLIYVPVSLPEQMSAQGTTDKQGDIALKTFMLQNVVRERVLNQFGGALFAYNDTFYVVLIKSGGTDDHVCEITERLKQVSAFYKSALDFYPCIVLSRPLIGVKNIADTFSRLQEELRYQLFWMDETVMGNVWREGDSAGVEEKKDFGQYLDYSRRLMNCLEIGNYKEASAVLDDMFLHAFPRGKADLKYNVYRMYGLISTISMTLNANTDSKDQAFGDSLNYEERLFSIKNFGHFRIVSKEIFSAIL